MAEAKENVFYFAYGSNLCKQRMGLSVKNSKLHCLGELKNYKFEYSGSSNNIWHGAVSNIVEREGYSVLGAVWLIDEDGIAQLDKQECVAQKMYYRTKVDVVSLADQSLVSSYVYIKCDKNEEPNKPSPAYKNVIINGAIEIGMPQFYVEFLKSFNDNSTDKKPEVNIHENLFKACY